MKNSNNEILTTDQPIFKSASPQAEVHSFGTLERLELAKEDLVRIQKLLLELAAGDPQYYGQLIFTASRIRRASKEIDEFLSPYWRRCKRWNDN